jgi:thioredoxin-dependent peroxiredoxin
MIQAGTRAPDFTLEDQDGKKVRPRDFAGKWVVLYFYPKDDTPGCTVEACDFTSGLAGFEHLDATVLGVSPDSPESHRLFVAKHGLKVRLLSDPTHATMETYGAWGEKTLYGKKTTGVIRSTFLVDPKGYIAHVWPSVKVEGHAEDVRRKIEELRAAA